MQIDNPRRTGVKAMAEPKRVVIIGGVACGPKTAARLRRLDPEADITLIDKGKVLSYGACGMPYYVAGDVERIDALVETPVGVKRDAGFFKKVKGFEALTETEATQIDGEKKVVETKHAITGEKRSLSYDKLVLATGASPFVPPISGLDLVGVYHMHDLEDASKVKEVVARMKGKRAVIIGAGLIGVEMAEAFRAQGMEVSVVEMLPTVMGLLLDEEMGRLAMKHMTQKGVELRMNERVEAFEGDAQGKLRVVKTSQGEIEADLALVAIGVRPNSELAARAGLAVDPKGGILINKFCQTSDPDIYAGGDCVTNAALSGLSGHRMFCPQGSTSNKHGRIIANHIAGRPETFDGVLGTVICKAFDITIGRTGLTEEQGKELSYDVESVLCPGPDMPHYYPAAKPMCIKLVVNRRTRQLIGFQAVGAGDVAKRLDVAATAMSFGATIDAMAHLDLGYAPPYSPPLDPILTAVHIAQNKLDGITRAISPVELKRRMDEGDKEMVLLDVRSPKERTEVLLPYEDRTLHIPLGALRERTGELPMDKWIIPFCKLSLRGYEAERILSGAGLPQVSFLDGGILGWPYELIIPEATGSS
jgi:NADPH-dependent 2,4-dienoyl-CoA reductase/sulfur reductase-like enzyme/rhodanese-related sulfurtransferase